MSTKPTTKTDKKGKNTWVCGLCNRVCKTRKRLVEHLTDHLDVRMNEVDFLMELFEELDIENPYD